MRQKKPLIAVTPYHNTENNDIHIRPTYLEAIHHAGGIPVLLTLEFDDSDLTQLIHTFDGFLFSGGPDVHPFYFGEETLAHCGNVSMKRDGMELTLLKLAMDAGKPVLGICRGMQLMNIGLGGDIYQDIPSQFQQDFPIAHTQPFSYDIPSHSVTAVDGTLLAKLMDGETAHNLAVNSMHHQAVRNLAPGLIASGYAPGQLVEAIEKPDYPSFFLGVQWHPEYLWRQDQTAAQIFSEFVKAATS